MEHLARAAGLRLAEAAQLPESRSDILPPGKSNIDPGVASTLSYTELATPKHQKLFIPLIRVNSRQIVDRKESGRQPLLRSRKSPGQKSAIKLTKAEHNSK
jgi:hypothetical protein